MDDDERVLVENLASHAVDGYFYRDETDYNGWFRILTAELAEKSATPFYDKLKQYVRMAKDSWHTPGHAGGDSLKGSPWVGIFTILSARTCCAPTCPFRCRCWIPCCTRPG
jgi:arginine decarboxylase